MAMLQIDKEKHISETHEFNANLLPSLTECNSALDKYNVTQADAERRLV